MTTFYVPVENQRPGIAPLQRFFFHVVETDCRIAAMRDAADTWQRNGSFSAAIWAPHADECPSVTYMLGLKARRDSTGRSRYPKLARAA